MPVNVIGTLKPKNNGKFPVAEAVDIKVTDDLRLDEALENKADLSTVNFALDNKADKTTTTSLQSQITTVNSALDNKADKTTTTSLQSQINEIITPVTQDAEVQNARVGADGTNYNTLKNRLDAENAMVNNKINDINILLDVDDVTVSTTRRTRSYWWNDSQNYYQQASDSHTTFFYAEPGKKYKIQVSDNNRFLITGINTTFDIINDSPENIPAIKIWRNDSETEYIYVNNANYPVIGVFVGSSSTYPNAKANVEEITGTSSSLVVSVQNLETATANLGDEVGSINELLEVRPETEPATRRTRSYWWNDSQSYFQQDRESHTVFFYPEEGEKYSIDTIDANRLTIVGITNYFDIDDTENLPQHISGTKLYENRDATHYEWNNNTQYPVIGVFVGSSSAYPNATAYIGKIIGAESNVARKADSAQVYIARKPIIGSPEVYISEETAEGYTDGNSYALEDLYAIYDELCENYPDLIVRQPDIGIDATNTYEIRRYTIGLKHKYSFQGEVSEPGGYINPESITNYWVTGYGNTTAVVNTGMHGNEKAPCIGTALAIKELIESTEPWALYIKANLNIELSPCLNPYGFVHNQRRNSNNIDINRDFGSENKQSETLAFINFFDLIKDNNLGFYLDMHGSSGYYAYTETRSTETPVKKYYPSITYKLASALYSNWSAFWKDNFDVPATPYLYHTSSVYSGTQAQWILSTYGIPTMTGETPQDIAHGDTNSYNNDLRTCKITKDLLINLLQGFIEISDKSEALNEAN